MSKQIAAFIFCFSSLILTAQVCAETAQKSPVVAESIIGADSMAKMITALLLVLVIIIACSWALKRFSIIPSTASNQLKVVAATGIGQRERVVVVEIGDTWLVLGVAPGQVRTLHIMAKPPSDTADSILKHTSTEFSDKLDARIEKSDHQS